MGLLLCSKLKDTGKGSFCNSLGEEWHDEESDTDYEESQDTVTCAKSKLMSADVVSKAEKANPIIKRKSQRVVQKSGFSLQRKMSAWARRYSDTPQERVAKEYAEALEDNTLEHLNKTVGYAGLIVNKGAEINEELTRQGNVLRKADINVLQAEHDVEQTIETLRKMKCPGGKAKSVFMGGKPVLKTSTFIDNDALTKIPSMFECSRYVKPRSISLPVNIKPTEDTKQQQIMNVMGDLHAALDVITIQQLDTAEALKCQEEHMLVFEDEICKMDDGIKCNAEVINNMLAKF